LAGLVVQRPELDIARPFVEFIEKRGRIIIKDVEMQRCLQSVKIRYSRCYGVGVLLWYRCESLWAVIIAFYGT
jgi:hypothetical protein